MNQKTLGAVNGAIRGGMIGGPLGAVLGGVAGASKASPLGDKIAGAGETGRNSGDMLAMTPDETRNIMLGIDNGYGAWG
jgi:hypothetical protein